MKAKTHTLAIASLCALCAVAQAQTTEPTETVQHGLWLSLQTLPTSYEVEVEGFGSNEDDFDSATRLALGYRYRRPGNTAFVMSMGLAVTQEELDGLDINGRGLVFEPGVSFLLAPGFELDLVGMLGFGASTLEDSDSDIDEDGSYAELGLFLRPGYQFSNGIRLYGDLGVLSRSQSYEIDGGTFGELDLDITSSGLLAGLGIGYNF